MSGSSHRTIQLSGGGLLLALLALIGCGGDDGGGTASTGKSAAELTAEGWTHFTQAEYGDARLKFSEAIGEDSQYGPAYAGQGWARMVEAVSGEDLDAALGSFNSAVELDEDDAYVYAGRAAARLAVGGVDLGDAAADAQAARARDPDFVFTHRPSFGIHDLYLIESFARVAQGEYATALALGDLVAASGIDPANSASWIIDGTDYSSFAKAVLAYLEKLSELESG